MCQTSTSHPEQCAGERTADGVAGGALIFSTNRVREVRESTEHSKETAEFDAGRGPTHYDLWKRTAHSLGSDCTDAKPATECLR